MPALLATPPRDLSDIALPPSRLREKDRDLLAMLLGRFGVQQDVFERARHAGGRGLADLLRLRSGDLSSAPDAVLFPRNENDVLAALKFCAEHDVGVMPFGGGSGDATPVRGSHGCVISLNLSDLNRVTAIDTVSGLAEVEAGITGPVLERQLAARGMTLGHRPDDFEFSTLGGWIAQPGAGQEAARYGDVSDWLRGVRVATPQGLLKPSGLPNLTPLLLGSRGALGVITGATIRIRAVPAKEEHRAYLFPDFASGLAAVREAHRTGLPHSFLHLSDDAETRLTQAFQPAGQDFDLLRHMFDIYLNVRRFDSAAARLVAGFAGSESDVTSARKRLDGLAKRLGALPLGLDRDWEKQRFIGGYRRDTFLDRGVSMDACEFSASWAKLPALYVAVRAALKQAMRNHAPRANAHGLVLCRTSAARGDSATLTFTWLFPRILTDGIAQAARVRNAAMAAASIFDPVHQGLQRDVLRGVKQVVDMKAILNPGALF
jgi:alkyldihydroxyacetonephosphate synthase